MVELLAGSAANDQRSHPEISSDTEVADTASFGCFQYLLVAMDGLWRAKGGETLNQEDPSRRLPSHNASLSLTLSGQSTCYSTNSSLNALHHTS